MAEVTTIQPLSHQLPDISGEKSAHVQGTLDKVGMEQIEMPIQYKMQNGQLAFLPATINAYVSLDEPSAKGIHMSRLYLALQEELGQKPLSANLLVELLENFIESHQGLSHSSFMDVSFTLPVERKALVSGQMGWRQYNVGMSGELKNQELSIVTQVEVVYSSTCPCSAALSRQLNAKKVEEQFQQEEMIDKQKLLQWMLEESSVAATPHAQRSFSKVKVKSKKASEVPDFIELIDLIEEAVKTPVQTAVKRSDEQEFARLNASNLMFCEDAGRMIKDRLNQDSRFLDFWAHIRHEESLHAHNAVSVVSKGVKDGWK